MRFTNNEMLSKKLMAAMRRKHAEILETLAIAKVKDVTYDTIKNIVVEPSRKLRTTGGTAYTHLLAPAFSKITVNANLFETEPMEKCLQTFVHELVHIIANFQAGRLVGHSNYWKQWMEAVGAKPERCHSMDVRAFRRQPKQVVRYQYNCACGKQYFFTKRKHEKIVERTEFYKNHYDMERECTGKICGRCFLPLLPQENKVMVDNPRIDTEQKAA